MINRKIVLLAASLVVAWMSAAPAFATTYRFTVRCENREPVVHEWNTGDIDPGREYLRVVTGTNKQNQGCSVGDYDPNADYYWPAEQHSGVGGAFDGLPPDVIVGGPP